MEQESPVFNIIVKNDTVDTNVVNIHIKGELSFNTVPEAYARTRDCFNNGEHVQVDLSDVQRTDSAAIALILEWHRLAKEHNARIILNNIPVMLKKIASVSDLDNLIHN